MLESNIEKSYFISDDIVNWWNPEGENVSFSEYLVSTEKLKRLHIDVLKDFLKNLNFENKIVLDAGIGKGRFASRVSENGALKIIGLDMNKTMLSLSRSTIKNINTIQGDIEQIPISSRELDAVCCMETLIHVPDVEKAIKEFNRILKTNGELVVNVQNKNSYLGYFEYYGVIPIVRGVFNYLNQRTVIKKKNHTHLVSKEEFEKILKDNGFVIKNKISYGKYFTVLTTYICIKNN